jgi:hypothetical protein
LDTNSTQNGGDISYVSASFWTNPQPWPTIQQITQNTLARDLPLLPYSSIIANCFLWLTYGMLENEIKVWGINLIKLFFVAVFYFLKFVRYAPAKSATLPGSIRQHLNVCLTVMAGTFGLVYLLPPNDPASVIGKVALLFCVAMFGSSLAVVKTALQTKSANSIPSPFTLETPSELLFEVCSGSV